MNKNRLKRHPIEFAVTTQVLDKFIKPDHSLLDVAAGTGAYSLHYARKGCKVIAEDITPRHMEVLQKEMTKLNDLDISYRVGDTRQLELYPRKSFDVLLCMGPIYHLIKTDSHSELLSNDEWKRSAIHGLFVGKKS